MGQAKSQESSSEAVNAYYGAYLFGEVAGDSELADFAKMLLATEIRSAQKYWQTWPGRGIYDERLAKIATRFACARRDRRRRE